jgi:PST family polysaccharide transporter
VHVLLWVVVNVLFADPLVQRQTMDDATFATAFMASVTVGCVAAVVQGAFGYLLSWSFDDHRLTGMSLALALALPLVGAAGPIQGMLTRNRSYRQLAWRTLIGQGGGTLAGIVSALLGAGAWALIAQQLVTSSAGAIVLLAQCPMRPRRTFSSQRLWELLRIGLPLTIKHVAAARSLPTVRVADRRYCGCGCTRPGTYGIPTGRCCARTCFHRAMAAHASDTFRAAE